MDELFIQSDRMQSVLKDCYSISDRLKRIGIGLNSVNHPDNVPQQEQQKAPVLGSSTNQTSDGLIGQLDGLIRNNAEFLREYNDKVLEYIFKNLNYIEKHI